MTATTPWIEPAWRPRARPISLSDAPACQRLHSVIVRLRFHQPTIEYVARRTTEGKTQAEIIRCLKR